MGRKPTIAIIGPGRLGSALAVELSRAGYTITEIISRKQPASRRKARQLAKMVGAQPSVASNAKLEANLIWFCVPDRQIAAAARALARIASWKGKIAIHSSGALASDELDILRKQHAAVASVHPLMTFVRNSVPTLRTVPFAIEGDPMAAGIARQVVRDLGGQSFIIQKRNKSAYHAWGTFASPLVIAVLITAEQVARAAGVKSSQARKKMLPIVRQTIENYGRHGKAGAFSGPLIRGDAEIVRRHLEVLKKIPGARDVYLALARSALRHLPIRQRKELHRILKS